MLACVGVVLFCALLATGNVDEDAPLWLLGMAAFVFGFTVRRVAKRGARSIERGEEFTVDRFGPGMTSMLERSAPFARPLTFGTAEPEPGLHRHVVIGDAVLIAVAAIGISALLVLAMG